MTGVRGQIDEERAFGMSAVPEISRLHGVALAILRDRGEAEDAVQETMVRAWRYWKAEGPPENARAWFTRICVNHCINRHRHLIRRGFASTDTLHSLADQRLDRQDGSMDDACRKLSRHQRALITLHYYHGYSLDECATLLGTRPGTVRSHLNRALGRLRKELSHA